MLLADLLRRAQSLVGLGRRHLDVDDRDVGLVRPDLQQQIVGRAALPDDLEALALEQARDALAQKHGVVGEDDTDGRRFVARDRGARRRRYGVSPKRRERRRDGRRSAGGASSASIARAESSALGMKPSAGLLATSAPKSDAVEARGQDHLQAPGRARESVRRPRTRRSPVAARRRSPGRGGASSPPGRPRLPFSGLGHDDEAASLEQLSRRCAEGAVVVDDEHAPAHGRIVPAARRARQCG